MRQDLNWYPKTNSVNTVNNRLASDDLKPNQLQEMSNFSYDELGGLKKISGNQPITTITEYTSRPDDTDMVDLYWDSGNNPIDNTDLRATNIGLKFPDAFIATLSGLSLYEAYLYLDTASSDSVSGTAYRATAAFTESSTAPPAYDNTSSASISHAGGINTEKAFQLPNAWITSWLTNNYGMLLTGFTGSGYFRSSDFPAACGFIAGGQTGAFTSTKNIESLYFSNETIIPNVGELIWGTAGSAAFNSSDNGYIAGGQDIPSSGYVSNNYEYSFTTQTVLAVSSVTYYASYGGAVNSSLKGYWGGGYPSPFYKYVGMFTFSTKASSILGELLAVARQALTGVNSSTYGYFAGGVTTGFVNSAEIDGVKFSDDTAINPAATLSIARQFLVGGNSTTYGYFFGGDTAYTEIDGIKFSDNTAVNPTAVLTESKYRACAFNSLLKTYISSNRGGSSLEIDFFTFSDESCAALSAELSIGRGNAAGFQSGGIL